MARRTGGKVVALTTSGLGNGFGGIGVVSELIVEAIAEAGGRAVVWRNPLDVPRRRRLATFAGTTLRRFVDRPAMVVHEHVDLARMSVLAPWLRGVPYAVFLHGTELWRPLDALRRRALLGASLLVANSEHTVRAARAHNPWLPEATVTWLGVRRPAEPARTERAAPVALIVGRMDPTERQKGHDWVLDAWPAITAAVPEATLRIIGGGDDRARLEARVREEALRGVTFLGRLDDGPRNVEYASARLFMFPSLQEGFGLAAVEAAVRGSPILGVTGTVVEELFPRGEGAVLADDTSAAAIARVAIPILSDAGRAAELGAQAARRSADTFLAEHFVARFAAVLRSSLSPD